MIRISQHQRAIVIRRTLIGGLAVLAFVAGVGHGAASVEAEATLTKIIDQSPMQGGLHIEEYRHGELHCIIAQRGPQLAVGCR